jgi:type IV secretion system protein VirB2
MLKNVSQLTLYPPSRPLALAWRTLNSPKQRRILYLQRAAMALTLLGSPGLAYAQTVTGGESPQTMINAICTFILGPFGETIAVLGIIGIGFLFMFGRASLGVIAGVIGGIVIMFGASYLGQTLTGGG